MKFFIKLLVAAFFVLALDIILPFSSAAGLDYVKAHGKLLLFGIGLLNVIIGGGISGGFLDDNIKTGFSYWFKPIKDQKSWNPTYGFAALILIGNLLVIIFGIEP